MTSKGAIGAWPASPNLGRDMDPLSLADAIAADIAFDDAIAAAIERRIEHLSPQTPVSGGGPARTRREGRETMIAFDDAFRELLADFAGVEAGLAIEQLRQKFKAQPPH